MNQLQPALDCYTQAARVIDALRLFKNSWIPRSQYLTKIRADIRDLLIKHKYVSIGIDTVLLTVEGQNMIKEVA